MGRARRSTPAPRVELPDSVSRAELRKKCQKMLAKPRGESECGRAGYRTAVLEFLCALEPRETARGTV